MRSSAEFRMVHSWFDRGRHAIQRQASGCSPSGWRSGLKTMIAGTGRSRPRFNPSALRFHHAMPSRKAAKPCLRQSCCTRRFSPSGLACDAIRSPRTLRSRRGQFHNIIKKPQWVDYWVVQYLVCGPPPSLARMAGADLIIPGGAQNRWGK